MISGIDLVDYGAGGFYPEKVYVVKGGSGTGKSILGLQFLTRGLELQEPGILITDQRPENVLAQAKAIGFPIEDAVRRGQLQILNPSKRYFDLVESPSDVMAIIEELGEYVKTLGARRMVVDPIYTLVNTSYSSHFAVNLAQSVMNALEEIGATTLLIAGDENDPELNPIIRMLEQNAFGVITLAPDTATGGRTMRLSKLRYASAENLSAHYRILNGRGLMNYRGEGEKVQDVTQPWEESATASRAVLVIGAQPDTIQKIKSALADKYEVSAETDPKRGLERARSEHPALVLVTPSAGSVSTILELAQNSTASIAFLSPTSNRANDKILYLRAGADDFITEPFTPLELRARVEALTRRSGRRLNTRDSSLGKITQEEITRLANADSPGRNKSKQMLSIKDGSLSLDDEFDERLQRNVDTVSKFDMDFALYWIKGDPKDQELNRDLARLCRQEDILCRNANGEFVALLTGTDENGVRGFEARLQEKLGGRLQKNDVKRGYALHRSGEPLEGFTQRLAQQ